MPPNPAGWIVTTANAALDQRLLLAVLAQAGLGEVHDLGARLGVLQLRDVDVLGADARLLERGRGRLGGGRRARSSIGIDGLNTSKDPKRRVRNATERR